MDFLRKHLFVLVLVSSCAFGEDLAPIELPKDEATHNFDVEWWYYVGHLQALSPEGKPRNFAYELTVFRGTPADAIHGYVAHFAFIDLDKKEHHPFQAINPLASKRPPAPSDKGFKFVFRAGLWSIEGLNGLDHLKAFSSNYGIDLQLVADKAAALFGDQGIVDYGPTGKLAYYSRTRIQTKGTVTVPNAQGKLERLKVVGTSWMDHQWGNTGDPRRLGWDWFSIQLTNDVDFMLFNVRDTTTKQIIKTLGFIIDQHGAVQAIPEGTISIVGSHPYSFEDVSYPMQFDINAGAPFNLSLVVKARFPTQRFQVPGQITPIYWEGSSVTTGSWQGIPVEGQGFTEIAGIE